MMKAIEQIVTIICTINVAGLHLYFKFILYLYIYTAWNNVATPFVFRRVNQKKTPTCC